MEHIFRVPEYDGMTSDIYLRAIMFCGDVSEMDLLTQLESGDEVLRFLRLGSSASSGDSTRRLERGWNRSRDLCLFRGGLQLPESLRDAERLGLRRRRVRGDGSFRISARLS
jgi:hypothetical protein